MGNNSFFWLKQSLIRKISGLSAILLSFIFVVIVYSIIKLLEISREMLEVAEVDIPLTEVISEVEILQLQQHILMEQIRFAEKFTNEEVAEDKAKLSERFEFNAQELGERLKEANELITHAIATGQVDEKLEEHKQIVALLALFDKDRVAFTDMTFAYINRAGQLEVASWRELEKKYTKLDEDIELLLRKVEKITEDISRSTEKHEREFMIVNIGLGISAFIIGGYITLYIILSFRRGIVMIQGQLDHINESMEKRATIPALGGEIAGADELTDLANYMQQTIDRFSNELNTRYEVEEKLIELAVTDKLTGALNRHKWEDALENEIELGKRGGIFSLISIDLDHFKAINDTYGHQAGDQVLITLTKLVEGRMRKTDLFFRLGGEEFMLLARKTGKEAAHKLAEQLRQIFSEYKESGLPAFKASFGVTEFSSDDTAESMLERVDKALYQAKGGGRNQVVVV